jgi:hypothetical protein
MKPLLTVSALIAVAALAISPSVLADDNTASVPATTAPAGSPASTDSKNQENTPAGPADQASKAPSTTPADSKSSASANSTTPVSQKTRHPNEGTKPGHKKHHPKKKKAAAASTNTAPAAQ